MCDVIVSAGAGIGDRGLSGSNSKEQIPEVWRVLMWVVVSARAGIGDLAYSAQLFRLFSAP